MNRPHASKEVFIFFVLTLGASYFVFWGPLAVFHIPAVSFVTDLYNWTEIIPFVLVSIFIFVVGNAGPQPSVRPAQA